MRIFWQAVIGLALGLALPGGEGRSAEKDKPAPPRDPTKITAAIDREVDQRLAQEKLPVSPQADDAEFCRRVHLDLVGRIPTAVQAAAFLDSKDPAKRRRLIDELLASPDYGRHFGIIWSDLIVKRDDTNRALNTTAFKKWLADAFNENRGWDKIVRDLLTAEGTSADKPTTTFFLANRDNNAVSPAKLVGTTANLFLGQQLQCAQCHTHPFIRGWKQTDFWGMAAFFSQTRSSVNRGANQRNNPITVGESLPANTGRRPGGFRGRGGPTVKGAAIEIPDVTNPRRRTGKVVKARFFQGEEPTLGEKGPFRPALADWLTSTDNKFFARASVNRLWAHFFARGFVNPLEDMQDDNSPSHPELLKLLTDEFKASGFDRKHLIRAICNSKAYQRTSRPLKGNEEDTQLLSHMPVKVMSAEVLYDSLCTALGTTELRTTTGGGRGRFGGGFRGAGGGPREAFVTFFSTREDGDDGTEFTFGIPQFLRLINSRPFNQASPLLDQMVKDGASTDKILETLFLATLSRRPTEAESKKLAAYVAKKKEARDGYAGVLWVLINSAEFVCVR
jgi:hypothetical protein